MKNKAYIQQQMNYLGSKGESFVFLIDFLKEYSQIFPFDGSSEKIKWQINNLDNSDISVQKPFLKHWKIEPVDLETYRKGFDLIQKHIHSGDTYLLNYTFSTPVGTNLSLEEIFHISVAPYKILLMNRFVCFSP